MSAALCYPTDGAEPGMVFDTVEGSYNTESLIRFLEQLHGHYPAQKMTLIWDGLPSHRSKQMSQWVRGQRAWLVVERLPAYAPELNPVEQIWGNVKGTELANLCTETIEEAAEHAEVGLNRAGSDATLCFSFLRHCGLRL